VDSCLVGGLRKVEVAGVLGTGRGRWKLLVVGRCRHARGRYGCENKVREILVTTFLDLLVLIEDVECFYRAHGPNILLFTAGRH